MLVQHRSHAVLALTVPEVPKHARNVQPIKTALRLLLRLETVQLVTSRLQAGPSACHARQDQHAMVPATRWRAPRQPHTHSVGRLHARVLSLDKGLFQLTWLQRLASVAPTQTPRPITCALHAHQVSSAMAPLRLLALVLQSAQLAHALLLLLHAKTGKIVMPSRLCALTAST